MAKRLLSVFAISLALFLPFSSADEKPATPVPAATATSVNDVPGLKLPADFSVNYDESFVTLKAECDGPVDWIVLSTTEKIKYKIPAGTNEIDIGIPPKACVITVFCYGLVSGKLTKAARCNITVTGATPTPTPSPSPTPNPSPTPAPATQALNITIIQDPTKRDPSYTLISQWVTTENKLKAAGHKARMISISDPWVTDPRNTLLAIMQKAQVTAPALMIQDAGGKLLGLIPCPKTEAELMKLLSQGGQ